jgi:hypothetical protein
MWAEIYKRMFVNVRQNVRLRLRTHVRNRAALGCCVEVYERTFVTVQHLVDAQKFMKM